MNNLPKAGRVSPYPIVGSKFGKWVVIETGLSKYSGRRKQRACLCRCSCPKGTEAIVTVYRLNSGQSKTCGCVKYFYPVIPIGTRFGYLEVVKNDLFTNWARQQRACLLKCKCCKEVIRSYGELRRGRSTSCGCMTYERDIESAWNNLLDQHKRRGWECHLTIPQLKMVTQLPCAYCGMEPSNIQRLRYRADGRYKRGVDPSMEIRWSGLDRVDSELGYIPGNVVPCCIGCNRMKSKLPLYEFLSLIERIQKHKPTADKIQTLAATLFP